MNFNKLYNLYPFCVVMLICVYFILETYLIYYVAIFFISFP